MAKYIVWTNVTEKKAVEADAPQEAAAVYHQHVGTMPDEWDGTLHVRSEQEEEWTYRRRKAA